jgi:hypothetical protein
MLGVEMPTQLCDVDRRCELLNGSNALGIVLQEVLPRESARLLKSAMAIEKVRDSVRHLLNDDVVEVLRMGL